MSRLVFFVFAMVVWVLLTWPAEPVTLVTGVAVAALTTLVTGHLFTKRPHLFKNPVRYWYFCFIFVPVFVWQCLQANLDVAWRVLNPKLPIQPGIVKVQTGLRSDIGLTFLANTITLTPGTMTVDIDGENGVLYVHWIDVKHKDVESASRDIAGRFEYILKEIFE
ncbi:MAG: Na+/H+ antiporter subunit E [Candidatus Hydrogenedentota bacterium]